MAAEITFIVASALELCVLDNACMNRPIPPLAERLHAMLAWRAFEGRFVRSIGNGKGDAHNQFNGPCGAALLPHNGHIIVCDYYNHRLQIVNPTDGTFVRSILGTNSSDEHTITNPSTLFSKPYAIAVLPNGHVVVTDCGNHRIQLVDPSDGALIRSIGNGEGSGANQFRYPYGLVALSNEEVVVCDSGNHRLQIVNPSTGAFIRSITEIDCQCPYGVALLPNGYLVVSDNERPRILIVDPSDGGRLVCAHSHAGAHGSCPSGVAVFPNGSSDLAVLDPTTRRLLIMNASDGSVTRIVESSQFNQPIGVAILPNGHVVVCDFGNNCLQVLA